MLSITSSANFIHETTTSPFALGRATSDQQLIPTIIGSQQESSHSYGEISISRHQAEEKVPYPLSEMNHWAPMDATALIHALVASFSVILVSELGDKTFIITAIMAMKNSRSLVFISSASALFLMTVLSVGMGVAVTVIPKPYTHYASIVLFLCFGLKMLKEAYDMKDESEESEFEEVKRSLEEDPAKGAGQEGFEKEPIEKDNEPDDLFVYKNQGVSFSKGAAPNNSGLVAKFIKTIYIAPIVIKVFTMILVAEWGDRSQISTVILAAREDVIGVFIGSFVGHVLCTGLAVIGGRFVAEMISVRTMTFLGGITFLFFSTFAVISGQE